MGARSLVFDGGCTVFILRSAGSGGPPCYILTVSRTRSEERSGHVRSPCTASIARSGFEDVVGQCARHPHADQRHPSGPGEPRLPVRRAARHGQDLHREDPGHGAELRSGPRQGHRSIRTAPARTARPSAAGSSHGRPRDRRRLQPRHRRDPRPARPGAVRAGRGAHEGLHRGRGPHADPRGLQRALEDARGTAGRTSSSCWPPPSPTRILPTILSRCQRFDFRRPTLGRAGQGAGLRRPERRYRGVREHAVGDRPRGRRQLPRRRGDLGPAQLVL